MEASIIRRAMKLLREHGATGEQVLEVYRCNEK
jgi:hypothetical protein